jgi:capsular polysaccharide export protein
LPAKHYRGRIEDWRAYLTRFLDNNSISHLFLLGDQRPHHKIAIVEARARGIEVVCGELGYLRPDWLVLERDGMSSYSRMPRDPSVIRSLAPNFPVPDLTVRFRTPFWLFATLDIIYNLGAAFFWPLYPGYVRHAIDHPVVEYLSWVRQWFRLPTERRHSERAHRTLLSSSAPTFVLPLQLSTDYQIRAHSTYSDMVAPTRDVIVSFAENAAPDARLVIKRHPLDPGLTRWRRLVRQIAAEQNVSDRVLYLHDGDLGQIFRSAAGCVTINSTAALQALQLGCPVKVLGNAIFDVPGMTFQGPLEAFWSSAKPPDASLVADFVRLLAGALHIRGGYYTQQELDISVPATVERLEEGLPWLPPREPKSPPNSEIRPGR